jgi:N-acetylglucosaminyldiphosphoundecaprenol N-acetyl-beta-D-mannosaminyltransferase
LWLSEGARQKYFVTANPHSLYLSQRDPLFLDAIRNADLIVPDGIGIVIASKILAGTIRQRVTGSDIFTSLSSLLNGGRGASYFFLGSTEQNLISIKKRIEMEYPNITVAGIFSPPFKDDFSEIENNQIINLINKVHPDILWIGMTAPKQEKWAYLNRAKLDVKFIGPVGALFDFFTGRIKRSHPWFQRHGLEWLPRLMREPKRLWRRNFISNPLFMLRVLKYRLSQRVKQL